MIEAICAAIGTVASAFAWVAIVGIIAGTALIFMDKVTLDDLKKFLRRGKM